LPLRRGKPGLWRRRTGFDPCAALAGGARETGADAPAGGEMHITSLRFGLKFTGR